QGGEAVPNVAIDRVGKPAIDERQGRLLAAMDHAKPLPARGQEGFRVRDDVYHAVTDHMMEASRGAVSPKGFELSARRIGRLMQTDYNLAFVDVGGWGHHRNQGSTDG